MKELDELLYEWGIDLECQSPLEIRERESGSFATRDFAELIVYFIKNGLCTKDEFGLDFLIDA